MEQSLATVMKNVWTAVLLDGDSRYQEAYIKYTESILSIVSSLLHNVKADGGKVVISREVVRHIQLAQQCMDRLQALVQTIGSSQKPDVASLAGRTLNISAKGSRSQDGNSLAKRFSDPVPPLLPDSAAHGFARKQVLTPMELAYQRNHQLMSAYKQRMERLNKGNIAVTLSLTVQRKLAENLAIAKAQEEALARKMKERQDRLEEQTERRFTAPMGMSEDEQEQRQIYKKILEYEQDSKVLLSQRQKLENNPEDPIVISQLIQEILRCSDHPLTQLLKKYQFKVYERLYPLVDTKLVELKHIIVPLSSDLFPEEDRISEVVDAPQGPESEEQEKTEERSDISSQEPVRDAESSDRKGDNQSVGTSSEDENEEPSSNVTGAEQSGSNRLEEKEEKLLDEKEKQEEEEEVRRFIQEVVAAPDDENEEPSSNVTGAEQSGSNRLEEKEEKVLDEKEEEEEEVVRIIQEVVAAPDDDEAEQIVGTDDGVGNIVENSKDSIEEALEKGRKLEKQLTVENKKAGLVLARISECEKYNVENMDDLFDDDDDNESESEKEGSKSDAEQVSEAPEAVPDQTSSTTSMSTAPGLPSLDADSLKSLNSFDLHPEEITKMSEEAYQRHLSGISQDVHTFLEKLLLMFTIAYEKLDSATGRDQCYASLEEPFFKPIWKYLLALFRLANKPKELGLAYKMTVQRDFTPEDCGVAKKLRLISPDSDSIPYSKAIEELKKVKEYYTMLSKLECVVRVCRDVCAAVEEFYKSGESHSGKAAPSVGADDLLPVLTYVVVKTELPQLVSECQAMSEFIHEGYIMGEEGYCLTSLQTAVKYLINLNMKTT